MRKNSWSSTISSSGSLHSFGDEAEPIKKSDLLNLSQATSKEVDANPEFTAAMNDWKNILETATKLYPSTIEMQNRVKNICYETSVLNEEAFCALASNGGNIEETIESLKDADFFNSVRTACNVFDVRKYALGVPGEHRRQYPLKIRMDRVAESAALPNISLPQWTPDRRVMKKSKWASLPSLSEYERKILEQDFSNRRLMAGNGLKGGVPTKNSYSMEKSIEYHMLAYEAKHLRAWQRAKHVDTLDRKLKKHSLKSAGKLVNKIMKLNPRKFKIKNKWAVKSRITPPRNTFEGIPSSLGHDGVIPILRTAHWSSDKHLELKRKGTHAERIRRQVSLAIDQSLSKPPLLDPLLESSFRRSVVL